MIRGELQMTMTQYKRYSWLKRLLVIGFLVVVLISSVLYGVAYLSTDRSQVARALIWGEADVADHQRFPFRIVDNAPPTFMFQRSNGLPETFFTSVDYPDDGSAKHFEQFLIETGTTAFLIIRDDRLLYEQYFNGHDRSSTQTSFSVTKSFVSALVGIAIEEGYIGSVDDPITQYIPELTTKDPRFNAITLKHLLSMSSGIKYTEGGTPWSDDSATYYAPDLRALALSASIIEEPGKRFLYNNFNPLLIGLILERTTGRSVAAYMEEKIWQPLGMEAPGSWSMDSTTSQFEKMESGINGRAIDFAKFGRLYLQGGEWNGRQLVPHTWVDESTRVDTTTDPAEGYQYFWWVTPREDGRDHFSAMGNHGQFIYIAPEKNLILVRFGKHYGYEHWPELFEVLASKF